MNSLTCSICKLLIHMLCVDVSSDTSIGTGIGTGVGTGTDVRVEEEKDVTQELVSRPSGSNATPTPNGLSQGPSQGVGAVPGTPAPTRFIEVKEGSKAYDMLKAGQEQRWKDVRAFVEAGEDIHSVCYSLDVCTLLKR